LSPVRPILEILKMLRNNAMDFVIILTKLKKFYSIIITTQLNEKLKFVSRETTIT
jgi:hypothetical protein